MFSKRKIVTVAGIVTFIALLIYGGLTIIGNLQDNPSVPPSASQAMYQFTVANTGQQILTNKYDQSGQVYTLHGYWAMDANQKWRYYKPDLPLDQKTWGKVTLSVRR